jgi:hypothetical protein
MSRTGFACSPQRARRKNGFLSEKDFLRVV